MASRVRLSLKEKVDIIFVSDYERLSVRNVANKFKISKSQASEILKRKKELIERWSVQKESLNAKRSFPKTSGLLIDSGTYQWYLRARAANLPVSGPIIRQKALEVAKSLGNDKFKASMGWLEKFKLRHSITYKNSEIKSLDVLTVDGWNEKILMYCIGYDEKDIYMCDETGLFFRALPEKTEMFHTKTCKNGEIPEERLTVLLCVNMVGEFEQPLIVGMRANPNCLDEANLKGLDVDWTCNRNAWMTRDIMSDWLNRFNNKMHCFNRQVVLFLDCAASHTECKHFSNVKLVFLAPNTSSICQPMSQDIIRSFKVQYRKCFLRHLLANVNTANLLEEVAKKVNTLNAIHWIYSSVNNIEKGTVRNCFLKSGFPATAGLPDVGKSQKKDNDVELEHLLNTFIMEDSNAYVSIDNALLTEDERLNIEDLVQVTKLEQSPKEIVQFITAGNNEVETNKEQSIHSIINANSEPPMSAQEALIQLNRLKQFFISLKDVGGFTTTSQLQNHLKQILLQDSNINKKF